MFVVKLPKSIAFPPEGIVIYSIVFTCGSFPPQNNPRVDYETDRLF